MWKSVCVYVLRAPFTAKPAWEETGLLLFPNLLSKAFQLQLQYMWGVFVCPTQNLEQKTFKNKNHNVEKNWEKRTEDNIFSDIYLNSNGLFTNNKKVDTEWA